MEDANAINQYTCAACKGTITTVNRQAGVTPFNLLCRIPGCMGTMTSAQYRVDQAAKPDHEWYRPNRVERRKMTKDLQEHVQLGGLILRQLQRG